MSLCPSTEEAGWWRCSKSGWSGLPFPPLRPVCHAGRARGREKCCVVSDTLHAMCHKIKKTKPDVGTMQWPSLQLCDPCSTVLALVQIDSTRTAVRMETVEVSEWAGGAGGSEYYAIKSKTRWKNSSAKTSLHTLCAHLVVIAARRE